MQGSGLLGKKMGMTQIFDESGECIPVTVLRIGPCAVVQKKTAETDGYTAVQIGYESQRENRSNKPAIGHFKRSGCGPYRYLREIRAADHESYAVGQVLDVKLFHVGDSVDVTGKTKGKGFQGVIKRHGFKGGPGAHGSHFHRVPGSIGQCTSPGEVHKGRKMPGRMGANRVTIRNLRVVAVSPDENILIMRGAVPGPNDSLVFVRLNTEVFEQRIKETTQAKEESKEEPKEQQ